ncbi:MAG: GMC family oxidoreductase [Solirubrobacteraceae bacterium]|nr:MAG: oxidoreductase [Solirubrobacterales bacterium]
MTLHRGTARDTDAVRPTGAAAYTDGSGTFHPSVRRLLAGEQIRGDETLDVDACVIGSGAGGAPVAAELAEGGMRVVMLEEGRWWETDEFTARTRSMTARLYRDAGQVTTVGGTPIVLPLGKGVGGTTVVNSGTCFRTPAGVLELWRERFGLDALTEQELEPYFRRVERILNVSQVPAELAGANTAVVRRGAEALGWSGDFIYRNAKGCVGSGVCNYGCPTGAKQHVGITYVPRAWAAGATTYTSVRATGIETSGGRARAVIARTRGGGTLRVRCGHVVVACGAIHTPLLLSRAGIGARSGELGRNLAIHPATALRAIFEEPIGLDAGVPQSYYIDEHGERGIMFEGAAGPPDGIAMSTPGIGAEHRELMRHYAHLSQFGIMVSDSTRGSVSPRLGRPLIHYRLNQRDADAFAHGIRRLTELYWTAGAHTVMVPLGGLLTLRDGDSGPLEGRRVTARDLQLMAFHPLGTARAGADPASAVVDGDLRVHGTANVHVADASAIPSSLGVNPQITIMALATRLARHLLGTGPPAGEPAPEHMARPKVGVHS